MNTIQLTIGHNVHNSPKWTTGDVCAAFEMVTNCNAYTAIPCYGMWNGQAEQSTRIEIVTDNPAAILDCVPALCDLLEQDAIMCAEVQAVTSFVAAPVTA